jgi:formylglycine-generating enzyme required for sulfatase activity
MGTSLYGADVDLTDMVRIPAGSFVFGVSASQGGEETVDCVPSHRVYMEEFWIDRMPVTYSRYREFLLDTEYVPALRHKSRAWQSQFLQYLWNHDRTYTEGLDDIPVVFVTWYDAMAYCEWSGKSLPTEMEWEKAARGTDGRTFPWGSDADVTSYCNCPSDIVLDNVIPLTPVDRFPGGVSPYGCADMLGNAGEWCWNTYQQPDVLANAQGDIVQRRFPRAFTALDGELRRSAGRAVRGGGRTRPPLHVAQREPADPWDRSPYIGFRCVWYPTERA